MKTESKPRPAAKRVNMKGQRMLMLPEAEYDRLLPIQRPGSRVWNR